MGIEYPYLAMLALAMFTVGVMGVIYLYIHIYSETLKTPVLSTSAISCYNTTSTILSITVKHERGDAVELYRMQVTSDVGIIDIDIGKQYQDVYVEMVNFDRFLYPGQIGRIKIKLRQGIHTENKTYHIVLYFDKATAIASFETVACEKLALTSPETLYLLYITTPPIILKYPLEIDINRISRVTLTYTDFEIYPLTRWTSNGGTWGSVSGVTKAKGNVIQGTDDEKGIGSASYYYNDIDLSERSSLWIIVKTRFVSGSGCYGIAMIKSGLDRVFTVVINTTGYLEIWDYNVVPPALKWTRHRRVAIPGYNVDDWYIIVVSYTFPKRDTISITAYLYDSNGGYINSIFAEITHGRVFNPAYIGVIVDGVTAQFDDFLIATSDPRNIVFTGLYEGMVVEVWDSLGNFVVSGVASGNVLSLNIVKDAVIGTGVNGEIRIMLPYGNRTFTAGVKVSETDAILGGDSYGVSIVGDIRAPKYIRKFVVGENNLFAYVNLGADAYADKLYIVCLRGYTLTRLKLIDYTNLSNDLNLSISLVSGITEDVQRIEIIGSSVKSNSTSMVSIAGRGYIAVSGIVFRDITLYLLLECYSPTSLDKPITHIPIILEFKAI